MYLKATKSILQVKQWSFQLISYQFQMEFFLQHEHKIQKKILHLETIL